MATDDREQPARTAAGNGAPDAEPAAEATAAAESDATATEPVDEVTALRAELADTKDRLLRERADLENYKKRIAREKGETLRYGSEALLREILPAIDNLDRALDHARGVPDDAALVEGIELVRRGLLETLERHGVRPVAAHGAPFDPAVHEAISHVESEHPPNTVVDELQRGYAFHDRLLRPALVTVGKGPVAPAVEKAGDDG
jgi:molecular chaperone GrpE